MSVFCGPKDSRIRFSKSWTLFNFFLSTLQILGCGALLYEHVYIAKGYDNAAEVIGFIWAKIDWLHPNFQIVSYKYIFGVMLVLHATVAVLTTLIIFWDWVMCCCCPCWLGEGEWRVYDPDQPGSNLVWRGGSVVNLDRELSRKALYTDQQRDI